MHEWKVKILRIFFCINSSTHWIEKAGQLLGIHWVVVHCVLITRGDGIYQAFVTWMIYNRKLFSKTELFQLRCYPKIGSQKQWGVHTSVSFRVYATFLVVTIALKQAMDHCKNPVLEQNSFVTTEWNWFVFLSK